MRPPLFVRALTDKERTQLAAGSRSSEAVVLRHCQIVLASARGERVPQIAQAVGCSEKPARPVMRRFSAQGVASLAAGSTRPHRVRSQAFAGGRAGRAVTGPVASQSTGVRQARQPVDVGLGRGGECCPGREPDPRQRRDDPPDTQAPRRRLEAHQAVDHQPGPGESTKKSSATA